MVFPLLFGIEIRRRPINRRMDQLLASLEKDTGFRVRVLCQNYPNTPGLAIRDYWSLGKEGQKDDKYIVLVVDQFGGRGNSLNFNVGDVSIRNQVAVFFWYFDEAYFQFLMFLVLFSGCQVCTSQRVLDSPGRKIWNYILRERKWHGCGY